MHARKRSWPTDCKFIQDRFHTMQNLKSKRLDMGEAWDRWCYRYDNELSWEGEWFREASWTAAKEATTLEVKFANRRVKQWRKLIAD
eukprot:7458627-Pyramimonas_sp.AAC.1